MPSAKTQPSTGTAVRSPEALVALNRWLATLPPNIRKRGEEDFASGQVVAVWSKSGHCLEAEVDGKFLDEVSLFLTRDQWISQCSCPKGVNCRHAAAAACAWIASHGRDRDESQLKRSPRCTPVTCSIAQIRIGR